MRLQQAMTTRERTIDNRRKLSLLFILSFVASVISFFTYPKKAYATSAQEELLDNYFDAVNNLDMDGVVRLTGILNTDSDMSKFNYFAWRLKFCPLMISADYLSEENEIGTLYLRGLGYTGSFEEMVDSYRYDIIGDGGLDIEPFHDEYKGEGDILFSNFYASYELLELKDAKECTMSYMVGLNSVEVPDMKSHILENTAWEDVDEVTVARLKIYWEFNDLPYGIDVNLSYLSDFPDDLSGYVERRDEKEYYIVMYRVQDSWYLYSDRIIPWSDTWHIEM